MNENDPLVCVIDDEPLIRESLHRLLRSAGLKVQTFGSAQEFLTNRPSAPPSCLVLDEGLGRVLLTHHLPGARCANARNRWS